MLIAAFVLLLFLVIYSYAVYPLILAGLSRLWGRPGAEGAETPSVTLIISVFNEEEVIARKLNNSLELDYPRLLLEILVVSDASTDRTEAIVGEFERFGVRLLSRPGRQGKTAGLNEAVAHAGGQVVVFTDADAMYPTDAIRKIVAVLGAPGVGLVTGSTQYVAAGAGDVASTSGVYTRLERLTKRLETSIGSCVGADGAMFAMRSTLFRPLNHDDINDFVIPLQVVRQGWRAVCRDDLQCREAASEDTTKEFERQIRITNRTIRALFRNADLMNPFRYPLFSFELISHKLLRLTVPIFLVLAFFTNLLLLAGGPLFVALFACQAGFYGAAVAGFLFERQRRTAGRLGLAYHFVAMNLAMLLGWLAFLRGEKHVTWGSGPTAAPGS